MQGLLRDTEPAARSEPPANSKALLALDECETPLPSIASLSALPATEGLAHSLRLSLDCVDYPMLCLNAAQRLRWANRAAHAELCHADHPLRLQAEALCARSSADDDNLRRAMREAISLGRCRLVGVRDGVDKILSIAVMPLGRPAASADCGATNVLIVFSRRQVCPALSVEWFARECHLTGAEGRVLHELSAGLRPKQIADRQGVAISTVRTHVRSLRSKTGAGSIGALLRQVAALPPMVGRVD